MNLSYPYRTVASLIASLFVASAMVVPVSALAALPAGFEVETLVGGLNYPTGMAFAPDGRVFVIEKAGAVRVIKNGALLATPLITLTDVNAYGDRGLLGIAVDPSFSLNGYLYLLYTYENTPGANFAGEKTGRLVRVTVSGDTADESTKMVVLGSVGGTVATPSCEDYVITEDCIPSDSPSHSVGGLRFGPDGALYVSLGDGAHYDYVDARAHRAQNIDSLAGKILRIHTDGTGFTDNPFYNGNVNSNRSKVYAYGVRNSYRFNFRLSTGALYVGDVGWNTWEEVNKVTPGKNYGWPCREGNGTNGYNCDVTPHEDPLYTYPHNASGAGSVAAGDFPTAYPAEYNASFFIGDYAQNWIKRVVVDGSDTFVSVEDFMVAADGTDGPVALDRGPDGNIYFISIYTGELKRILYTTGNRQPIAQMTASPTNGLSPLSVNFSGAGSSDPDGDPLTFSWNFGDGTTGSGLTTSHVYPANGSYTVVLTVTDGQGGLSTRTTTITVGNRAPTAVISSPATGSLYRIGDMIDVEGMGTDPEDGNITATGQLFWEVILHHNTHTHLVQTMTGPSPAFPALDHSGATDIYTEVRLTVTDSGGLTNTRSINLYLDNSPTGGGNLVQNPSLETAVPGAPDAPQFWRRGGWGVLNVDYAYPVAGFDGANAAQITVANYASGDAKWMHDPVSVAPNTLYTFRGNYKSTATAELLVQNGNGTGAYTYDTLSAFIPARADWTPLEYTFTTPAGGTTAVVALLLARNGTLAIDNFTIVEGTGSPGDTTPPAVSITTPTSGSTVSGTEVQISADATDAGGVTSVQFFIDGVAVHSDGISPYGLVWDSTTVSNGSHTVHAIAEDSAGNTGTSATISFTVNNSGTPPPPPPGDTNLIENPSFENETAGLPTNWLQGRWGTNTTSFTYPVAGIDGARAARVAMTAHTSGDAKWYFTPEAVTPGTTYTYRNQYQATVPTTVTVQYTRADGTNFYAWLADVPAAAAWTTVERNITVPVGAVSMSVFHHVNSVGSLTVDDYELFDPSTPPPPPPPPGDNLIVNGNLETENDANPENWTREEYGNHTATYTYPVTGRDGGNAAEITLTNYTDGAAYFVPEEIPMQAGKEYTFRMWYKGTTITDVIGRYILSDGSEHYVGIKKEIPPSATWTEVTATFVPPNSAVSLTPRYMMTTNGTFAFDDMSLLITGDGIPHDDITPPTVDITEPDDGDTLNGTVTATAVSTDAVGVTGVFFAVNGTPVTGLITSPPFTFDWDTTVYSDGTHALKATTHDAAGNNAATTITVTVDNSGTPPPPGDTNLIENPSFENETAGLPTNWLQGRWGTNTTSFTYPVAGIDGARAARVAMTAHTSGDAKWYFTPEAVTPGTTYTYRNQYQATVPTTVTVQYTRINGTNFYEDLATLPAATSWTAFTDTITVPSGVASLSVFHHLSSVGTLTVDDYELLAP